MPSFSSANLLELVAGDDSDFAASPLRPPILPRLLMEDGANYDSPTSPSQRERRIIVSHRLPLRAATDPASPGGLAFSRDPDALALQLCSGLPPAADVVHVGTLAATVDPAHHAAVSRILFDRFRCLPVFIPADLHRRFYHGFCKHYLWPLLHYLLPLSPSSLGGLPFDRALWLSYLSANKLFADRLIELLNPDDDLVWIHDYHLLALPTFLRRRSPRIKLGFFLHSPFPSSEIFRTIPVRDELLRALLNSDLVGFHTFDYARHFLSSCSRLLGLDYQSKRGYIGIEYYGRTVTVKILPVGIDMGQLKSVISSPETTAKVQELVDAYRDRILMLGVDDVDLFKGIGMKFLAVERLLEEHPQLRGQVVLVQIANPARSQGKDVQEVQDEIGSITKRINERFGRPGYEPIVLIYHALPTYEKVAFYAVAECCIVNPVRDGMNLVPYDYTVCRHQSPALVHSPKNSMIVVSEFIGCSPSLSGAIRVNPWNVDAVAEAINLAITMPETEKQLRHEKHYKYVSFHDVAYWARSFDQDLQRACKDHFLRRCWGIGFGMSFRVIALGPNFRKLSLEYIVSAYQRTNSRLILLDYDGTMMPPTSIVKKPSSEVISVLNGLCSDPKNVVFLVSGRGKDELSGWFAPCEKLGISAEHGYFTRWNKDAPWESCMLATDFNWKKIAEPVMRLYMEATDGSSIEPKESALVWHHQEADPDFGSCQAKELLDHLENVLANEPVVVKRGQHIVEVNPQPLTMPWLAWFGDKQRHGGRKSHGNSVEYGKGTGFFIMHSPVEEEVAVGKNEGVTPYRRLRRRRYTCRVSKALRRAWGHFEKEESSLLIFFPCSAQFRRGGHCCSTFPSRSDAVLPHSVIGSSRSRRQHTILFSLMSTSPSASGIVCTLFHWVIDWINVSMRRRPGIAGLKSAAAARDQYRLVGENVARIRADVMKEQLETFRTQLEDFARKHKNDIRKNPTFRSQFHEMCAKVGVDPLASNKGFWAELLGIGDFYYELGVQIVDICLSTRSHNGGLINLQELCSLLCQRRKVAREAVTEDDCLRAISKLKVLGSGFEVISVGKKKLVRSVPTELNKDHNEILEVAQAQGYVTIEELEKRLSWSSGRAIDALETLLKMKDKT
ncbi:synthase [Musa troglodytarum]|uniref:Synthase n=1 Tax=Musa troglodytarum TaxID=320322 RepID=A0A9E7L4Q3_9LILI|nr:synthase [Musa troglodytarum]